MPFPLLSAAYAAAGHISTVGLAVVGVLSVLRKVFHVGSKLQKGYETQSLIDAARATQVEPITVISPDIRHLEYSTQILNTMLNLFVAYYLQAVETYGVVQDARVAKILSRVNPNPSIRDWIDTESYVEPSMYSSAYQYALPMPVISPALEASWQEVGNDLREAGDKYKRNFINSSNGPHHPATNNILQSGQDKRPDKLLTESANLAVGKVVDVTLQLTPLRKADGSYGPVETVKLPITVRLKVREASTSVIVQMLASKRREHDSTERYYMWKAGELKTISELVFAEDLIKERKKALMEDNDGLLREIQSRVNTGKGLGLLSANPSMATASNLIIISTEVMKELDKKMGGKFETSASIREKVFEGTYAMIIAVVDPEWEKVSFYFRHEAKPSVLRIKDLKKSSDSPNITDLLKALNIGAPPL